MHREITRNFTGFFTMRALIVNYIVKIQGISLTISRWSIRTQRKGASGKGDALSFADNCNISPTKP